MVGSYTKWRFTEYVVLLLIGVSLCSFYILLPTYRPSGAMVLFDEDHDFILSEDSPVFRYNITDYQIGISHLQTNNTPVSIVVRNLTQTIFNTTSTISLSDFYIEISVPIYTSEWWLEVIRQDTDADVSIRTHHWVYLILDILPAPKPLSLLVIGVITVVYSFYKLVNSMIDTNQYRKMLTIFLLLIIGLLCCYPLTAGTLYGDFNPVYASRYLPGQEFSFSLNGTHPNSSIELSAMFPEDSSSINVRIHNIESSQYPLQLSITKGDTYEFVLEQGSIDGDWWISIPAQTNYSIILEFSQPVADSEVTLRVEMSYQILIPRQEITIPTIFGILGASSIIIAIYISITIDRYNDEKEIQNTDSLV